MSGDKKPAGPKKAIIISACIAAALIIGICVLMFLPEPEAETPPMVIPPASLLLDMFIIDEGVLAVTFMPQGSMEYTVRINQDPVTYSMYPFILEADDPVFPGRQDIMDRLLMGATSLEDLRRVTENADDEQLSLFGFDNPRLIWQLHMAGGITQHIELGYELPAGSGSSYAKLQGSREVFVLEQAQCDNLLKSIEEVYDISYLPIPASTEDDPTWIYISRVLLERSSGETIEIVRRDDEDFLGAPIGASRYLLTEPFDSECNDFMIQTIFMEPITRIDPQSVIIIHPADLSPYGLDNPDILTSALPWSEDEDYIRTLLIGRYDTELGGRFVMIEGHDAVLIDTAGVYGFLDVDPHQLRQRLTWLHMIDTVSSVEFDLEGVKRILEISHDGENVEGILDGKALSSDNTRRLYSSALNILASGATEAPIPDEPAVYSIKINFVEGGSEIVELYPIAEMQYLIVRDGVSTDSYITRQTLMQNLLNRLDILDAGGNLNR